MFSTPKIHVLFESQSNGNRILSQNSNSSKTSEISFHYENFLTGGGIIWKRTELICTPNSSVAYADGVKKRRLQKFIFSKMRNLIQMEGLAYIMMLRKQHNVKVMDFSAEFVWRSWKLVCIAFPGFQRLDIKMGKDKEPFFLVWRRKENGENTNTSYRKEMVGTVRRRMYHFFLEIEKCQTLRQGKSGEATARDDIVITVAKQILRNN